MAVLIAAVSILSGCGPKPMESTEAVADNAGQPTPAPTRSVVQATEAPNPAEILDVFTAQEIDQDIINILLLGTDEDSSDGDGLGRNDTTMILQINRVDKTMKLVSFMRDLEVTINGEQRALNWANYIGGPQKVAAVMDDLFDIRIDYYASVSFVAFMQIMYILPNITIDVQETDVETLKYAKGAVQIENEVIKGVGQVTGAGEYELEDHLVLSYARDRHTTIEDEETGYTLAGDEARNYRQRVVVEEAWEMVKTVPVEAVPAGVFAATVYTETDMVGGQIITLITEMMEAGATIESIGIPYRTGSSPAYTSYITDKESGDLVKMTEARDIYDSAEDRNDYAEFADWRDAHYEAESLLWWNPAKQRGYIHDFLVID